MRKFQSIFPLLLTSFSWIAACNGDTSQETTASDEEVRAKKQSPQGGSSPAQPSCTQEQKTAYEGYLASTIGQHAKVLFPSCNNDFIAWYKQYTKITTCTPEQQKSYENQPDASKTTSCVEQLRAQTELDRCSSYERKDDDILTLLNQEDVDNCIKAKCVVTRWQQCSGISYSCNSITMNFDYNDKWRLKNIVRPELPESATTTPGANSQTITFSSSSILTPQCGHADFLNKKDSPLSPQ
jgi:hypothetical protein